MDFSIIVPVYNTEDYLCDCVESVLKQTYPNFELILVNDGSTDNSGEICQEYASKDARIQAYHKANSGQTESRSYGISKAVGDYVIFLDSDDMLAENALEVISQKIRKYECDMVIYAYERFVESPKIITNENNHDFAILTQKELCTKILFDERYNSLCIKAIKRTVLSNYDHFEWKQVRYGEDLLQTIDIIKQNPKTVIIDDKLYYYRVNAASLTNSLNLERYISDVVFVRNIAFDYLRELDVLSETEKSSFIGYSIKLLADCVANIARSNCDFPSKERLFNSLKESEYYKKITSFKKYNKKVLGSRRIIWLFFKNNVYRVLVCLFTIKRFLKK